MFWGIIIFSVICISVSMLIMKKYEAMDKSELVSYVMFIAWCSLFYGVFIAG